MAALTVPSVYRLTYADWCRLPEDGPRYEILEGELFVNPARSVRHQRVSRNLERALLDYLEQDQRGEVLYAPIGVRLSEHDVPEPDLVVILKENAHLIGEQVIEGSPDLVVEILSPGSAWRDLRAKRRLYAKHGIAEYWIVCPEAEAIEVLTLSQGDYIVARRFERHERLISNLLPGFGALLSSIFPPQKAPC